ncbi:hypothetical protein BDV93DRAFT_581280 [Ceratobasidium sp. AG-I]|nr:hypothetical protein BDV93DRAFT_581280 [Ceratobasidium sp. AG-I]
MSKRPTVLVPATSSPPVRDSQPKSPDPNDPSNGPIPGHAVFDTPPPDSQPIILTRDQRSRVPSTRKREQLLSEGKLPASTPTSNAVANARTPSHSSRSRKSKKRAVVLSASDDDDEALRPRQARDQSTKGSASQSEPSAQRPTVAARRPAGPPPASAAVTLDPGTAATLGKLFGVNLATTSPQEFEQTIRALSDSRTQEMAPAKRYAKVRGTSPSPLPTLSKEGGYHRDRLEAFALPSGTATKRSNSLQGPKTQVAKRPRIDREDMMGSMDELAADPDADMSDPEGCPPLPPPLFGTQLSKQPSVSSTQGAAVNAPSSRLSQPAPPPTLPTRKPVQSILEATSSARGLAITPVPEPRKIRPSADTQAASSRSHQRVHATQAPIRKDPPPPPRKPSNPSTATESETESEPSAPPRQPRPRPSSRPVQPSKPPAAQPNPNPSSSQPGDRRNNTTHTAPDQDQLMDRLKNILAGGDEEDVLKWAMHFVQKRTGNSISGPSKPRTQPDAAVDLRSRFHANVRSRTPDDVQRHARYPRLPEPSPPPIPGSDNDLPEPEEVAAAVAAVAGGAKAPVANDDEGTGLGKYRGQRGKVATKAIIELLAMASEKGVYQNQEVYLKWCLNCYRRAWKVHAPHVNYQEAPDDLLKTMALRVSWLRTKVKERLRLVVRYKLGFQTPGGDNAVLAENQRLFAKIFPNTFHCRNHVFDNDQYEHPAFVTAVCEAFFWTNDSFAVQFPERFERVSLPAIAFVLTMMQECIEEWQTGRYNPRELSCSKQRPIFDAHLRGLYNYVKSARDRMFRFRGAWFKAGIFVREHAGVTIIGNDDPATSQYCQPVTRAENVRPDTPPPNHINAEALEQEPEEPVPELEYDGDDDERFSTKSKGKSKALNDDGVRD